MRPYYLFALLLLSCDLTSNHNDKICSNSRTSNCGGFKELAKITTTAHIQDSSDYCQAEKIIWTYTPNEKKLEILHTRISANCASNLEMSVEESGGKYTIIQKDTSNIIADCNCVFDTYCEIQNVKNGSVDIVYNEKEYKLNAALLTGEEIINTNKLYQCRGYNVE